MHKKFWVLFCCKTLCLLVEVKEVEGPGAVNNMRETIERHVHSNKNMFERAKNTMLEKLNALMVCYILYLNIFIFEHNLNHTVAHQFSFVQYLHNAFFCLSGYYKKSVSLSTFLSPSNLQRILSCVF